MRRGIQRRGGSKGGGGTGRVARGGASGGGSMDDGCPAGVAIIDWCTGLTQQSNNNEITATRLPKY